MVRIILTIKSPGWCAITKQACRDESIVSLFFSTIATYIAHYFYVSSTVNGKINTQTSYIYIFFFPSKFLRLFSRRSMLINCWNFTPEKAFDGRRFINYVIRIFEVMSMDFCDSMCLWNLTVSALILINEWRKTNKKDHYFDHPADIGVASLANTHLWKKWKKVSEISISICR